MKLLNLHFVYIAISTMKLLNIFFASSVQFVPLRLIFLIVIIIVAIETKFLYTQENNK